MSKKKAISSLGRLSEKTIKGGFITMAVQPVKFLLQLISVAILARILSPSDFGLIAMSVVVTGLLAMFQDLGLSDAIIQAEKIDEDQLSMLFLINIAVGSFFCIVTYGLAGYVADLYEEPRMREILRYLSFGFIVAGASVQHSALAKRDLKFGAIAVIDILALFLGIVAGVVLAVQNFGFIALVWMQLTSAIAKTICMWGLVRWRPGKPSQLGSVNDILLFGAFRSYSNIISFVGRNADKTILGLTRGAHDTGLYGRAFTLILLPVSQIATPLMSVMVPALSRLQSDDLNFERYYLNALKILAYLSMPLVVLMLVLAEELIYIFLGEQWAEAVPIFRVLALAAFWLPVSQSVIWVYVATGRARAWANWVTISSLLYVVAYIFGAKWGPLGVACAYTVITWLTLFPMFFFCFRANSIGLTQVFETMSSPILLSVFVGLAVWLVNLQIDAFDMISRLIAAFCVSVVFGGIFWLICPPFRRDILSCSVLARTLLQERKAAAFRG